MSLDFALLKRREGGQVHVDSSRANFAVRLWCDALILSNHAVVVE
jgi:hypothetical protein